MPDYASWIAEKRAEAEALGGKPLRNLPGAGQEFALHRVTGRTPGEIVNPITGEVVSDCLTIAKLSASLGMTSSELTDKLEAMGYVNRVLKTNDVPMVCDPVRTKPCYYHSPEAAQGAIAAGLVVPLTVRRNGIDMYLILITPEGQRRIRETVTVKRSSPARVDARRKAVADLLRRGHSQSAIVHETGIPKQTVSRIAKTALKTG